jgi:hypothetical protein
MQRYFGKYETFFNPTSNIDHLIPSFQNITTTAAVPSAAEREFFKNFQPESAI